MSADPRLVDLVLRWEEQRDQGQDITPEELCRDCPELLDELRRAIAGLRALNPLLTTVNEPAPHAAPVPGNGAAGEAVGWVAPGSRYQPRGFHARGGLGEIHRGEDVELHRPVALKRIQEQRDSADNRRRFLREAEITARLQHPGIVPVYGLVQDEHSRPYYAMRFIEGESLKDAIRRFHDADRPGRDPGERNLALRRLLTRFVAACRTVAYAHSRGIMHLDLKPGNIMLGDYDETLIVDWGLARPFSQRGPERTGEEETLEPVSEEGEDSRRTGQAPGTPAYMSPEQAAGHWDVIGPASDVYSLGATLSSLLTGRAPFTGSSPAEVLQGVKRGDLASPRQVKPAVPWPLEVVCRKALAPRPEDRYATAVELAAEVERWLGDEPVRVYREPWAGRVRRWVRRHQGLTAGAAGILVTAMAMLAIGIVIVNRGKDYAEQEKERAERARKAESLARGRARQALDDMFSQVIEGWLSRQKEKLGPAQEAFLNKALASYREFAEESGDNEEVRSGVEAAHHRVGMIEQRLGHLRAAEEAYRRAIVLGEALVADFPGAAEHRVALASSQHNLGALLIQLGKLREAEAVSRDGLRIQAQLAADFPAVPRYREALVVDHIGLGEVLYRSGKNGEAEAAWRDALKVQARLAADFPKVPSYRSALATTHNNLGHLLHRLGKDDRAEAAYRDALKLQAQLVADFPAGPGYRQELAASYSNLGVQLHDLGKLAEAEVAWRDALQIRAQLAADLPTVPRYRLELADSQNNLSLLHQGLGKLAEAEAEFRNALKIKTQLAAEFPAEPEYRQGLASSHYNLSRLLADLGKRTEAEAAVREAVKLQAQLAAGSPTAPQYRHELARSQGQLGVLLRVLGRHAEAEASLREALKTAARLADDFPSVADFQNDVAITMGELARLLRANKDFAQARELLERADSYHQTALKANSRNPVYRQSFLNNRLLLASTLAGLGDHARAVRGAEQLAALGWDPADDAYNAACALAQCIPVVEKVVELPEAQHRALAQSYADRALALLRRAVSSGYKDAAHLKKDPDLDPLRQRDDFRRFLADLEANSSGK